MVLTRRPRRKAPARKRKIVRKRTIRRPMSNKNSEYATCKELYTIKGMTSNTPYNDIEQNLGYYERASTIAKAYQFFRIKYIKYTFLARYNVYQASTNESTVFPMPQLYNMVDKAGALPSTTSIQQLKDMGAKPRKFTRNLITAWKPGVNFATSNDDSAITLATGVKITPWLMTNKAPDQIGWAPNDTDHKGLYWFMETAGLPGDGTYEYDAEVEVVFEFKKPLAQPTAGAVPATRVSTLVKTQTLPNGQVVVLH